MKNPFYKASSYLNDKKKMASGKCFDEIKVVFEERFISRLNRIISILKKAKEFENENKLDVQIQKKYIQELNSQLKQNSSPLGVFKLKNDLAIGLRNQLLCSERARCLNEDLEWLTKKDAGIDGLINILDDYCVAFGVIEAECVEESVSKSFRESLVNLKGMIPDEVIMMDAQKIKFDNERTSYNNLKKSYYTILNRVENPEFKMPLMDLYPRLSDFINKGTNDPVFNDVYLIQEILNSPMCTKRSRSGKKRYSEKVDVLK